MFDRFTDEMYRAVAEHEVGSARVARLEGELEGPVVDGASRIALGTMDSPAPLQLAAGGKYPVLEPGIKTKREY